MSASSTSATVPTTTSVSESSDVAVLEQKLADSTLQVVVVPDACDQLDSSLSHPLDKPNALNFQGDGTHKVDGGRDFSDHDFDAFVENAESIEKVPEETSAGKVQYNKPSDSVAVENGTVVPFIVETTIQEDKVLPGKTKTRFVSPKDFELLKVIGMGAFGKVLQVRNKKTRQILAMKVISKRRLRKKSGYIENVMAEREILTKVRHPFVVSMHCSFQTKEKLFIIMDFLAGSELFLRLGKEGIFFEKDAAFYLGEIILALDHLHGLGIIHRDLKPENILLGSDGHVCITDFGLAKHFTAGLNDPADGSEEEQRALTICGTNEYISPEMLSRQGYGKASDYWSLGCIAYEMLASRPPFVRKKNESTKQLFSRIMSEKVKMPQGASADACKLIKGLLTRNVQNRLGNQRSTMFEVGGVSALKRQPFFKNIDWDLLEKKEVDPPQKFSIDHAEDLQHFHEEFTQMELPRSVLYMSQDNWRPRNVDSSTFPSFSFIHEDFVLPERNEEEVKRYWESPDVDGDSESEAASSKADFQPVDDPEPAQAKKKRPPRKRKKKNKGDLSTETTPAVSAATTPIHSNTTTPAVSRASSPVPLGRDVQSKSVLDTSITAGTIEIKEIAEPEPPSSPAEEKSCPVSVAPVSKVTPPLPPKESKVEAWQSTSSKNKVTPPISVTSSPKARTPQYHTRLGSQAGWTTVHAPALTVAPSNFHSVPAGCPNSNSLPSTARWGVSGSSVKSSLHHQSHPTVPSAPPSIPQMAKFNPAAKPFVASGSAWGSSVPPPPQQGRQVSSVGSSDWRQHSIGLRSSPASSKKVVESWPTLAGTTGAASSSKASTTNTNPKLQGSWAAKR